MATLPPGPRRLDPVAALLLALALALALTRFAGLSAFGLWIDEALSLSDSLHGGGQRNPLGYRLLAAWLEWLGERPDEASLRLPSALFGALGIPLTYLALRAQAGERRAAIAALLLAVSGWHLYWSQTARFYTLAQDLCIVGGGIVLHGLARDRALPTAIGVAVASAGAAAHPSAAFFAVALVLAPLLARLLGAGLPGRRAERALLVLGLVVVFASVPWMRRIWHHWTRANVGAGTPAHLALTLGYFVTPALGAAALFGVLGALRRRNPLETVAVLVPTLGLVGLGAASLLARAGAQYAFVLLPGIALAAAVCIAPWPDRGAGGEDRPPAVPGLGWARVGLLAVLVSAGLSEQALYFTVRHGERPRWREAWSLVDALREPEDLLFGVHAPVGEYYLAPERTDLHDLQRVSYLDRFTAIEALEWSRHGRRTWFVVNFEEMEEWGTADREAVRAFLAAECRLVRAFPVQMDAKDLDVFVFLRE